ncbi:Gag protease polyprotein [Gossypium australe]|uniref:Gag protease polyprotein n=1 Tax=Gossypium australe TaxID=47621 RepID=A0A5B6VMV1_9ROSI|nr:Gag protease polyprotein [Gossypium australe]
MDFVSRLPLSPSKKNSVWVVVDRLTNSTHFLHVNTTYSLEKLAELYIAEVVCLHGVPSSIISDRDPSIAFHPQRNGQSERVIQVSENMMCFCMINFGINWERHVPLIALA